MKYPLWFSGIILAVPQIVNAANLGPFAPLAPTMDGLTSTAYIAAVGWTAWRGHGVLSAYREREMTGMGPVFTAAAVCAVGALFMSVIVPGLVAPLAALGATP